MYSSQAMQDIVNGIVKLNLPTEFVVDLQFTNSTNPSFSYSPLFMDSMTIDQDYADGLCDEIMVMFKAKPEDYMTLFDNRENLRATLKITYIDPNTNGGQYNYSTPPVVKTYVAHMCDPQDLRATQPRIGEKTYPMVVDSENIRIPVKMQMMNKVVYDALHRQYVGKHRNGTVLALIHQLLNTYGITKCEIVPPDNTNTYSHLVIPPGKNITQVFEYIQDTWGIYLKGADYYYDDTCFWMYPGYENSPTSPFTLNVYNNFKGWLGGVRSYHQIDGKTTSIVATLKTMTQDMSKAGAENYGTGTAFIRSTRVLDGFASTDSSGTHIASDNSLLVTPKIPQPVNQNANNIKYRGSTDNMFKVSSDMAMMQTKVISTGWDRAIPYTLNPGTRVFYYNDNNGVFEKSSGILESIRYTVAKGDKLGLGVTYKASAMMTFRIDPVPLTNS